MSPPRQRLATRLGATLLAALLAIVVVTLTGDQPVRAADGARLTSSTVYRLDTERPAVLIETEYRMTNVSPDRSVGGGRYEYYFFTGATLPIDSTATEIDVQINGRDGDYVVVEEDGYTYLDVRLGYELRYQKTATIVVRSTLRGEEPRSDDSFVRVNRAYASFPVFVWADDGEADVRIEVPRSWTPEYVGDDLAERPEDDITVFEAVGIESPVNWSVLFTMRDDAALESEPVVVGDAEFEIRPWPGDDVWLTFVGDYIVEGLPVLEELIGAPWPESNETDVIEASTPYLRGYAGFYDSYSDVIEVGEELDDHVLLHELAHAWFNHNRLEQRWLSEGLAEEVSARALERLDGELPDPMTDADLRALDIEVEPFPLNEWDRPTNGFDDPREDYGYAASFRVMRALWDEIGADRMDDLLAAVIDRDRAYPGEDGPDPDATAVDWQNFLDLAEQVGDSETLADLYTEFILTGSQIAELERRNDVVAAYTDLLDRSDTWAPPAGLRAAMAGWSIARASDRIDEAHLTLDRRDDLIATLAPIDLVPGAEIEVAYQDAITDLAAVDEELDRLGEAATSLVAARRDLDETLGGLGLDVPAVSQHDYERAPIDLAATTADLVADAGRLAATAGRLDEALARHALSVPSLAADAFVSDRDEAQATLDARLEAAEAVAAAHDAVDGADSLLQRIGRIGSGIDDEIEQTDTALAAGDTTVAIAGAGATVDAVDGLEGRGTMMLAALAGTVAVLAGIALVFARLRRRRATRAADAANDLHAEVAALVGESPVAPRGDEPPDSEDATARDASDQADAGEARALDPHD